MMRSLLVVTLLAGGCISEYQTARTLPAGRSNVSAAMTNTRDLDHFNDGSFDSVDLMARHGLSDQMEIDARYNNYGGASTLLVGPKISVSHDQLAFLGSLGPFWAQGDYGGLFLIPTFLWSLDAAENAEVTGAAKLVIILPDQGSSETYVGGDIGVRLSTDLEAWAFHPSIGFLQVDEEGESVTVISIGVALSFTR
jgi:hypothetical protein